MGSKAGHTNNPNGRPKGVPNKTTNDLRQKVTELLENNWEKIQEDIDDLEPRDRLAFIEKLLNYSLPKLRSQDLSINKDNEEQEKCEFVMPGGQVLKI